MTTPRNNSRAAFTLTELMISIALALLLIIGVNLVFQATSETLSAGQKVAEANRLEQSLHTVFSQDMRSLVLPDDAPFLFIRSERREGYINAADLDGPAIPYTPAIYNRRNHRIDTFGFFARGQFHRQTGAATNELVADSVASEAYIWYGHLKKPNYNTYTGTAPFYTFYWPAEDTLANNPENWFVEDWTLGRVALLLSTEYRDGNAMAGGFIRRAETDDNYTTASPFWENSSDPSDTWKVHWSRYDAADTSFQRFRRILGNWIENTPPNQVWYDAIAPNRFQYSPVVPRPLDPDTVAQSTPGLAEGTSQFIVEFAGDFLTQNNLGVVIAAEPDGVLDYIVLYDAGGPDEVRTTRWYGMPRDSDGNGSIRAVPPSGGNSNALVDVLPVADIIAADGGTLPVPAERWFERYLPTIPSGGFYAGGSSDMNPNDDYLAAWGPDTIDLPKPQYIRILVGTIPTSANADDRIAEYVFKVR